MRERRPARTGTWLDDPTRASLHVLAEGAASMTGFARAAISVRNGNDLEVVAISGPDIAEMEGRCLPVPMLEELLEQAHTWGALRFVPHDRVGDEMLAYCHVTELDPIGLTHRADAAEPSARPDPLEAWHPRDLLVAPIYDDGVLRGLLSVDGPADGRRPGPMQRAALASYARVARSSVLLALERQELAERVRLATEAREMVRRALGESSLELVIEACRSAVVAAFGAVGMWLSAFDADGGVSSTWHAESDRERPPFEKLGDLALSLAPRYWDDQYVADFSHSRKVQPHVSAAEAQFLLDFLAGIGIGSVLFVPLGVGPECLGFLVLSRISKHTAWTEMEYDAALNIGHDLGRAIANARQLEQERALVARLRELDRYRTELVNTVAHELRNPLTAVAGNLEMIQGEHLSDTGQRCVDGALRGTGRMEGVIDDLLAMARVSDPDTRFDPVPVDMQCVLRNVLEECGHAAAARSVTISSTTPDQRALVPGQPDELHRLLANLVSNAVKYSHVGGTVALRLTLEPDRDSGGVDSVVVRVMDAGLGIAEADQADLFREFFRSRNPEALDRPGSGLGLGIADRVVRRHGGRIEVESELDQGSTFTVWLPAEPTRP